MSDINLPADLPPDLLNEFKRLADEHAKAQQEKERAAQIDIPQVVISDATPPVEDGFVTCTNGFESIGGKAVMKLSDGLWKVSVNGREYVAHEAWAAWEAIANAQEAKENDRGDQG